MKIIPLSEGEFTVGADKKFVPFNSVKDILTERPTGSILVEVQPFLIITETDYILLDTGLGIEVDNQLQIYKNLFSNNILPSQITKVIMSHLHKDHASGMSYIDDFGNLQLSFPNATYYIYKPEFDFAIQSETKSYVKENFYILKDNPQVVFYTEEEGEIIKGITHKLSGGHCKHHQVIQIQNGEETIFYAGDEASQLKQLKVRFVAKYDFDGRKAADLRQVYAEQGKENKWQFLFYHDLKNPIAKLV
jgi:glyoxylase-like metal-dependent hydrolase (beta-lactamase superfamily II)